MKDTGMRECPNFFPVSIISKLGLDTSVISPSVKHELKVSLDDTKGEYYTIASQADVEVTFDQPKLEKAEIFDPCWVNLELLCSKKEASKRGSVGPFGLLVLASKGLEEQTVVFFRIFNDQKSNNYVVLMCSDHNRSSLVKKDLDKTTYGAFLNVNPAHDKLSLRTLIDHSIVESFGEEGKTYITSRVYPKLAIGDRAQLHVFNNGIESIRITSLSAWSVKKARSNQDCQQSIKELKEKADELKVTLQRRTYDGELANAERSRQVSKYTRTWKELGWRLRLQLGRFKGNLLNCPCPGIINSKVGNGETATTCPVDDYMRVVRDALNAKRYEMDSVLPVINGMKNARSIDDMLEM
ncbi:hypothetical protein GIB67_036645 [Kingdonia uniflora]|uniref:Glycosyl hydrolase family 32 C-terminal domain-containing protein n=1 Tax=Kingdonia uniflora TaxID=39325 RepID=A0A7J7LW98_9MAGN|nr:hypothetical protein GIB67_036645 [Kingdonia uniflora]